MRLQFWIVQSAAGYTYFYDGLSKYFTLHGRFYYIPQRKEKNKFQIF